MFFVQKTGYCQDISVRGDINAGRDVNINQINSTKTTKVIKIINNKIDPKNLAEKIAINLQKITSQNSHDVQKKDELIKR
jgi:hypothetical protein